MKTVLIQGPPIEKHGSEPDGADGCLAMSERNSNGSELCKTLAYTENQQTY